MNIIGGSQSLLIVEFNDHNNNPAYWSTRKFLHEIMNLNVLDVMSRCHANCIILYKGSEVDSWKEYMS